MQDRVPVNPGRVLITPENGTAPYYATMTRADNPTQEGTPLNKASLLKDATAALFGLGADAVPDDAFNVLSRFHSELGNEYVWHKIKRVTTYSFDTSKRVSFELTPYDYTSSDFIYYKTATIENGNIVYSNPFTPTQHPVSSNLSYWTSLLPFYRYSSVGGKAECFTGVEYHYGNSIGFSGYTPAVLATTTTEDYGYINSPNPNAYPVDDGYTYEELGQLGANAQVVTGSYTGTGTYGSSNKNSLTFDFVPSVIFVQGSTQPNCGWIMPKAGRGNALYEINNCTLYLLTVSVSGTTISWYRNNANNGRDQLNVSGDTYHYIAFS